MSSSTILRCVHRFLQPASAYSASTFATRALPAATLHNVTAFEQAVGNTRLLRLHGPSEETGCNIFGKAEYENPGGSVKDRAALSMLLDAEARGELKRGEPGVVVEGTAGNTGIGLALAARTLGYRALIVLADSQAQEKKDALRWAGAELIEVPAVPFKDRNNYVHVAARIADVLREGKISRRQRVFYANQWDNAANGDAHENGTAPEIWAQLDGKIDAFSCAIGTGGTIAGCARYFRRRSSGRVRIGLTDPQGGALVRWFQEGKLYAEGSSISEGVGQGRVTGNLSDFAPDPDLIFEVCDREMLQVLHRLQEVDGLALGGSAGINVAGAMHVARALGPGHTVVTVLCDLAARYAGKLYSPVFLQSRGLPPPPWLGARGSVSGNAANEREPLLEKGILDAVMS